MHQIHELTHRRSKYFSLQAFCYSPKMDDLRQTLDRVQAPERLLHLIPPPQHHGAQIANLVSVIHILQRFPERERELLHLAEKCLPSPPMLATLNSLIRVTGTVTWWQLCVECYYYLRFRIFKK